MRTNCKYGTYPPFGLSGQVTGALVASPNRRDCYSINRHGRERFAQWVPSDGFEIKAGWTSASNDGGFLLFDVVDVASLLEFSAKFKDLNDELEFTPVVKLGEGVNICHEGVRVDRLAFVAGIASLISP